MRCAAVVIFANDRVAMRRGGGGRGEYSTGCGGGGDGGGGGNECVCEISGSGAADRAGAVTRVIVTAIHTRDAHAVSKVVRRRLLIGHVKAYANADAGHAFTTRVRFSSCA